jgi:hypothetical protein
MIWSYYGACLLGLDLPRHGTHKCINHTRALHPHSHHIQAKPLRAVSQQQSLRVAQNYAHTNQPTLTGNNRQRHAFTNGRKQVNDSCMLHACSTHSHSCSTRAAVHATVLFFFRIAFAAAFFATRSADAASFCCFCNSFFSSLVALASNW